MTQLNESGEKNPARFAALDRSLKNAQEAANHFHAARSKAYAQHANAMSEYMIALFQEVRSVARLQMQLRVASRGELSMKTYLAAYETRSIEHIKRMAKAVQSMFAH